MSEIERVGTAEKLEPITPAESAQALKRAQTLKPPTESASKSESANEAAGESEEQLALPTLPIEPSAETSKVVSGLDLKVNFSMIPDKLEFKIGEVADLLQIKTYVLRFWETEFDALKPIKSKNNQRVYRRRDVETALLIKTLLYDERYSIEGARSALKKARHQAKHATKATEQIIDMSHKNDRAIQTLRTLITTLEALRIDLNKSI